MIDGNNEQDRQIVPAGRMPGAKPPSATQGIVWVVIGGFASSYLPYLGIFLLAYGMRELLEANGFRGLAAGLAASAGVCIAACFIDPSFALSLISTVVCAAGICAFMWRKQASVTAISLVICVSALVSLGIDAASAATSGVSITDVVTEVLEESAQAALGSDIQANLMISQIMPILQAIWPFVYVLTAMADALIAGIASYAMSVRCTGVASTPRIANFDAPLWCVGALAICILGLGVSFAGIPGAEVVRTVCGTCLISLRFVFMIQGFGVVSALTSKKRIGCVTRFLITFATVWLEVMCFAMCIIGLIDIWANFRKLARDGSGSTEAKQ